MNSYKYRIDCPTDIMAVKTNADLQEVVERYMNGQTKRIGDTLIACCPFHKEDTPSFRVYKDHYHCYGCGAHGDVIDFVKDFEGGISLKEAVGILNQKLNVELSVTPEARQRKENEVEDRYNRWIAEQVKAYEMVSKIVAGVGKKEPQEHGYLKMKGFGDMKWKCINGDFLTKKIFHVPYDVNAMSKGRRIRAEEMSGQPWMFIPLVRFDSTDKVLSGLSWCSAQYISEKGEKLFHKGLSAKGGFYPLWFIMGCPSKIEYADEDLISEKLPNRRENIKLFVEGLATGISVWNEIQRTNRERVDVIVTFSASNMKRVVEDFMHKGFKKLCAFADGDEVGVKAAKNLDIPFVYVQGMDANDYMNTEGADLTKYLDKALGPASKIPA